MNQRRMLIAAAGASLVIAGMAAYALLPSGQLSRKETRLIDRFVAAFTACMDSAGGGVSLGDCNEAKILKGQIDDAGLCIDYDNKRQDTYEDVYRCGSPR